jgi:hypothetical protein
MPSELDFAIYSWHELKALYPWIFSSMAKTISTHTLKVLSETSKQYLYVLFKTKYAVFEKDAKYLTDVADYKEFSKILPYTMLIYAYPDERFNEDLTKSIDRDKENSKPFNIKMKALMQNDDFRNEIGDIITDMYRYC